MRRRSKREITFRKCFRKMIDRRRSKPKRLKKKGRRISELNRSTLECLKGRNKIGLLSLLTGRRELKIS